MIAFLFPGQGSQQPGMGTAFRGTPAWELTERAADATGRDVARLLCDADADELVQTRNAQLGTFVHSMIVHRALGEAGITPDAAAGHSLGEFSALCAAGVLSFDDAARLVAARGDAMQDCCEARPGSMAAVLGLSDDQVAAVCSDVDGDVWVANLNAPGQVVIAGARDALDDAAAAAKDAGAKRVMPLDVSGAFHTPFMGDAADRLSSAIAECAFQEAIVPVVANVDAAEHRVPEDWPSLLQRQLTSPVRWTQSVETLAGLGATAVIEAGPGSVLTGTVKRIDRSLARHNAMTPEEVGAVASAMAVAE